MRAAGFYIWLLLGVARAVWGSNSCSYYYNVPKSPGASCESQGGVDRDLEEKIWKMEGNLEGIQMIGKASLDLVQTVQTTAAQFQGSQQMSNLDTLKKQMDGLKTVLMSLPTGNQHPRAVKSTLQKEAKELSTIEWKLINVSMEMTANERSRSVLISSMEKKLQAQEQKLTDLFNKIALLESKIVSHHRGKRAAPNPSSQAAEISNMTDKTINLRVEVLSLGKVEQRKLQDLTKTIDGLKKPVDDAKADLQNLTSSLNGVGTRIMKVAMGSSQLQTDVRAVNANIKPKLDQVVKEYHNLSEQLRNATSDYTTAMNDFAKKVRDMNQNEKDVTKLKKDFLTYFNSVSYLGMNVSAQHQDMVKLEQNFIVLIGKVDFDVKTFDLKAQKSLQQITRVIPVLQKRFNLLSNKPTTVASG